MCIKKGNGRILWDRVTEAEDAVRVGVGASGGQRRLFEDVSVSSET